MKSTRALFHPLEALLTSISCPYLRICRLLWYVAFCLSFDIAALTTLLDATYRSLLFPLSQISFFPLFSIKLIFCAVQIYTLQDPTSNTYGNENFTDLLEIALYSAGTGRPTIFFPESTYWVNYDINVPLNLSPVYAWRAVADLRLLAQKEVISRRIFNWVFWSLAMLISSLSSSRIQVTVFLELFFLSLDGNGVRTLILFFSLFLFFFFR